MTEDERAVVLMSVCGILFAIALVCFEIARTIDPDAIWFH